MLHIFSALREEQMLTLFVDEARTVDCAALRADIYIPNNFLNTCHDKAGSLNAKKTQPSATK
jgi:hypothetical protein